MSARTHNADFRNVQVLEVAGRLLAGYELTTFFPLLAFGRIPWVRWFQLDSRAYLPRHRLLLTALYVRCVSFCLLCGRFSSMRPLTSCIRRQIMPLLFPAKPQLGDGD